LLLVNGGSKKFCLGSCTEWSLQHPLVAKWVRALLPHVSTLAEKILSGLFLLPSSSGFPGFPLESILLYGARTFLTATFGGKRDNSTDAYIILSGWVVVNTQTDLILL